MQRNLMKLLGVAFVVAIMFTGIFYGLFAQRLEGLGAGSQMAQVVVAARALKRGTVLKESDVRPALVSQAVKSAFGVPAEVAGLVTLDPLEENEPVTRARTAPAGSATAGGLRIPPGMRAVSVQVSDAGGVVNLLRPGYKVDVQVVAPPPGQTPARVELRTVLQDIEVLHASAAPESGLQRPQVVMLLASPGDAEVLGLADSAARIRLVLRNPADRGRPELAKVDLGDLFAPKPAAQRVAMRRP